MFLSLTTGYSGVESVLKLIGLIILCVIIIAASYFVTKMIGRREAGYSGNSNFKAIEAFRLTPNKYLQLVQIGERYFVLAVCKENVTLICELDREDIRIVSKEPGKFSFKEIMAKTMHRKDRQTDDEISADDPGKVGFQPDTEEPAQAEILPDIEEPAQADSSADAPEQDECPENTDGPET